jgi:hypothetical protein
VVVVVVVEE